MKFIFKLVLAVIAVIAAILGFKVFKKTKTKIGK